MRVIIKQVDKMEKVAAHFLAVGLELTALVFIAYIFLRFNTEQGTLLALRVTDLATFGFTALGVTVTFAALSDIVVKRKKSSNN